MISACGFLRFSHQFGLFSGGATEVSRKPCGTIGRWRLAFGSYLLSTGSLPSQSPDSIGPQDQTKGESCDEHLAKSADHERAQPLLGHFAEVRAQADSGKGEQERPSRQVGERRHLVPGESVEADQQRE